MSMRSDAFESLLHRDISFFDSKTNSVAVCLAHLSNDFVPLTKATGQNLSRQMQAVGGVVVAAILGLSASWQLGLVALATYPVMIWSQLINVAVMTSQHINDHQLNNDSHAAALVGSSVSSIRTLYAFSLEMKVVDDYIRLTRAASTERLKREFKTGFRYGLKFLINEFVYALLFWYGAKLLINGDISFTQLMEAILCLTTSTYGVGQALGDMADSAEGMRAAKRIFALIDGSRDVAVDGLSMSGTRPQNTAGTIQFSNVSFNYANRPAHLVCKSIELTVNSGEVVALVGSSGSGKVNTIHNFYNPLVSVTSFIHVRGN